MKRTLFFLLQSYLFVTYINAANINNTDSLSTSKEIICSIEFYTDTANLGFAEIKGLPDGIFQTYHNNKLKKNYVYWFRIVLDNKKAESGVYFLHFNSMISNIELYELADDSGYIMNKSGALVPLSQKAVGGYLKDKLVFSLQGNNKTILYLRIFNQLAHEYDLANIDILSKAEFDKKSSDLDFLQGGFIGMMLIILIVNFFLFIFSRDKLYLYYSLYTMFTALFFFYNFQFSERYFFFDYPKWDLALLWSVFIGQFVYLFFLVELLKKENIPIWRKYVKYYAWFLLLFCLTILVAGQIDYYIAVIISDLYTLLNVVFVIGSFFIFYKRVTLTTKIVLTGSLIMVIGALVTTVKDFSDISMSNMVYYQLGLLLELILFTIAINYTYIREHLEKLNILYQNSILELEKKQKEDENRVLLDEVDAKNRVLASKAIILSEKETLIIGLIRQLNQLGTNSKDKTAIQKIVSSLKVNLSNNSWAEFEKHFNQVHPRFYAGLCEKYTTLTANERKLCAFLKLNLSTKEIAAITGKSQNTIDVSRSRLRKKIGLNNDENLHTVIANINDPQ